MGGVTVQVMLLLEFTVTMNVEHRSGLVAVRTRFVGAGVVELMEVDDGADEEVLDVATVVEVVSEEIIVLDDDEEVMGEDELLA